MSAGPGRGRRRRGCMLHLVFAFWCIAYRVSEAAIGFTVVCIRLQYGGKQRRVRRGARVRRPRPPERAHMPAPAAAPRRSSCGASSCGTAHRHPSPSERRSERSEFSDRDAIEGNAIAYSIYYYYVLATTYYIGWYLGTLPHASCRQHMRTQVAPRLLGKAGRLRFTISVTPRARRAA